MVLPPMQNELGDQIAENLPYLRRYGRALTGQQTSGDQFALAALETIVAKPSLAMEASSVKVALYQAFHAVWQSDGKVVDDAVAGNAQEVRAQWRLRGLETNVREALLLHAVERFSPQEIAEILSVDDAAAQELVKTAYAELSRDVAGQVMIIEDEAIIALDVEATVKSMGYNVTGIARTHSGALKLAKDETPDLILADIQLADDSSGLEAVNELLEDLGELPVIFITAFPERLLTGQRPEPAFLITKPYGQDQLRAAVSQAMFFASTQGITTPA